MNRFSSETFETSSHSEELDFIFDGEHNDIDEIVFNNRDFKQNIKTYIRLIRKKTGFFIRKKCKKDFTNILFLTLDCPPYTINSVRDDSPLEYIDKMRQQYPDKDIRVLIPIFNLNEEKAKPAKRIHLRSFELERTSVSFEFFTRNRTFEAVLYKFPKNDKNVQVYGLYSPSFSFCRDIQEISRLQNLVSFIKAARICIKKLSSEKFRPDIVHSENIPFYLGAEFEAGLPSQVKVLQVIKDFTQINLVKTEAFWAAINLANKSGMKKICRDNVIKKCIASLFNLHNTKRFYQMKECLNFIYKNFYKFRKFIDKGEDIDENIIFNRLNTRILQLFPQLAYEDEQYFNPMMYTLKRADFWAVPSKTYYDEIFANPLLSGKMFNRIEKTKDKSTWLSFGTEIKEEKIYQEFNTEDFREKRVKNKTMLLKELSIESVKTNFTDPSLFNNKEVKIIGNLDTFYDSPLFFVNMGTEIFANGVDIMFNTILKLFELHKNIQAIICIKDGLKVKFIKSWVDFLSSNKYLNGRWIFIDGEVNEGKFLAGSDIILLPRRANTTNVIHFHAMHYGCVPIASRSGILNDTISDIFDDITYGCGFKTKKSLLCKDDPNELFLSPVLKALNLYQNNPSSWNLLVKNCINYDSGWKFKTMEKYNRIYNELM